MRVSGVSRSLQRQGKGPEQTSSCLGHLTVQRENERGREACKISQRISKQTAKYGLNEVEKELPGGNSSSFVQGLLCGAAVPGVLHKTSTTAQTFSLAVFSLHPLSFSVVLNFLQFLGKSGHKEKIDIIKT